MSFPSSQYTLYYSTGSPFAQDETGREENFDDIVSALAQAFRVLQKGGNPSHLLYDDAWLFSGDDLKDVLKRISENVGRPDTELAEVVRETLPGLLVKQLVKTVKFAHEHFGAVTVYRSMLEELYDAADQAIQKKDLELLHKITGKLAFWYVPAEGDVKQWGKDFLQAYRRDAGWLHHTKKALEKIKKTAKELDVDDARNKELRDQIIATAENGLITRI